MTALAKNRRICYTFDIFPIKEVKMMIKIAVADDEQDMLKLVCRRVEEEFSQIGFEFEIFPFNSGNALLDAFKSGNSFDILFLDIQLSDCTGMELAKNLRNDGHGFLLVFVTSFDNYVFEAFDYDAQGYLRKSELDERLGSTVQRLIKKYTDDHRETVLHNLDGQLRIAINDIAFFESHGHTITMTNCRKNTFTFTGSLSRLEKEYANFGFFRVHSGYLVNLKHIYSVEKSSAVIKLADNTLNIPISRSRIKALKLAYQQMIRGV